MTSTQRQVWRLSFAALSLVWAWSIYHLLSPRHTGYGEHVLLARAMLDGHLYIDGLPLPHESFAFNGHHYLVQPPGPALLLLVFAFFYQVNQVSAAVVIGAVGVAIASLLPRVETWAQRAWLTAFFGFGTIYCFYAALGAAWGVALVASVPFTLLAVWVWLEWPERASLLGLCIGAAALMRYDLALTWPVFALGLRWRHRLRFVAALTPFAAFLLWWNWARFGSPLTTDLSLWAKLDPAAHGEAPFQLKYILPNAWTFFLAPPRLDRCFPYIHPTFGGESIFLTSPFFLTALLASWRQPATKYLWAMTALALLPSLTVYASGYVQYGSRYLIQVYPFLFGLICLRTVRNGGLTELDKLLIILSVGSTMEGFQHIRLMYGWGW